jgi:15-cis-phytoene synthase
MQIIQTARANADFANLHEMLVAADMDLTRMTYNTPKELDAYLERSGGAILEFLPGIDDSEGRRKARSLGKLIRRVETLRDLAMEARAARVYWALDELEDKQIAIEQLRATTPSEQTRTLIATESHRIQRDIEAAVVQLDHPGLRPIAVLAGLHAKLLRRIERAHHDVFTQRHELRPIEKVWTAWRVARRS